METKICEQLLLCEDTGVLCKRTNRETTTLKEYQNNANQWRILECQVKTESNLPQKKNKYPQRITIDHSQRTETKNSIRFFNSIAWQNETLSSYGEICQLSRGRNTGVLKHTGGQHFTSHISFLLSCETTKRCFAEN